MFAQTVNGRIPADRLGPALMHEHVLCDLRDPRMREAEAHTAWPAITLENRFEIDYFQNRHQPNMLLDDDAVAVRELSRLRSAGGGTLVDVTTGGLAPQPERLAAIAKRAGVNVIIGAGYYVEAYLDDAVRRADVDALADSTARQLAEGAWGSSVCAGIIGEIGCSWPLAPTERRMLVAAARVQRQTGVAITIHPGRHPDAPDQIAQILSAAGADPERTVVGHVDRTIFDRDRLLGLLSRGFVLEWDFFGIETSQYWMADEDLDLPTDYMRLDQIAYLFGRGHGRQIAISHDLCTRTRLATYGGHGYGHILSHVVPMMRRRGYRDAMIEQLLVGTPARLLAYLSDAEGNAGHRPKSTDP